MFIVGEVIFVAKKPMYDKKKHIITNHDGPNPLHL